MGKITSWSYSRWSDYDKCPQLAKFKHVDKLKEPENDAMKHGSEVHEMLSVFLESSGNLRMVAPPGAERFEKLLIELRELEPVHDQEWGFTEQWKVTGWFNRDTWFRSKLDVCVVYDDCTADVVDFKTGRESPSHGSQAELYAVSVLIRYPHVSHVTVRFWYLDTGGESVHRYARDDLTDLIAKWEKRVKPMLSDEIFAPKPGQHCKYCFFAKSKEGPCQFG